MEEELRAPRYGGAVRASLGVLAVLLVVQATIPFGRTPDTRCGDKGVALEFFP